MRKVVTLVIISVALILLVFMCLLLAEAIGILA